MLLQDKVTIRVNPKNIKSLKGKYIFDNIGDILEIDIIDLSINSHILVTCSCDICGKIKDIEYKSYISNTKKYNKYTCSSKCAIFKNEITNLTNTGFRYPSQSKIIREKYKNTMISRYGVDNSLKIEGVSKKAIEMSKTEESKSKRRETNFKRFGHDNISKSDIFFKSTKIGNDSNFIKYLGDNNCLFHCDSHNFIISTINYHNRIKEGVNICTICNPINDSRSIKEKEFFDFIYTNYSDEIIQSYRDGLEIDIYLPKLKIGFEFNGLYWHSELFKDKKYHLNKTNFFKERGIRIIHIWEDDWTFKREIVKSKILDILGKSKERIFARKCYATELLDNNIVSDFLNNNHIQGVDRSNIKLALVYNDKIVSMMTINKLEGRKIMEDGAWNISRFCNKLNTNVIGGASKLLKYFISNYKVKRIISYADKDWSVGKLYNILGFSEVKETNPDYKYIVDNIRKHKQNFKKSNLKIDSSITESKYMKDRNIYKIYDCGKKKYEKKYEN